MKEKVLLTGANGFIGTALFSALKEAGYYVIGIGRKKECEYDCDEYYSADISSDSLLALPVKDCFALVHAAASLGKGLWQQDVFDTNITGTFNVIKLALNSGCKKFVYTSSLPIIGKPENLPIGESHSVNPPTFYHATKLIGEEMVNLLPQSGINGISLRIPSPVGEGMPCTTILPIFLKKAVAGEPIELSGKGTRKQNYIDKRDICAAVLGILSCDVDSGVYNIGAKKAVSNHELAQLCVKMTNSKSEIRFNGNPDPTDDFDWTVDCRKAEKAFGFSPKYDVTDSINAILASWGRS